MGLFYNILFICSPWNRQNILNIVNAIKYKNKNILENIEQSILLKDNLNKSLKEIFNEKDEFDIDEESDEEGSDDNNDNNENKINEIHNNNNDLNELDEYKKRKYKKKNKKKRNRLTKEMIEYFYGNDYEEEIEEDNNE